MNDNNSTEEKIEPEDLHESTAENSRTWEGRIGQRRFRVRWSYSQQDASFHFQAPFTPDNDPDGIGVPFYPDLELVWERGKGPRASGPYAERLNTFQNELPDKIEKIREDLEDVFNRVRQNWSHREGNALEQNPKGTLSQRVRIEIEETEDPLEGFPPVASSNQSASSSATSQSERTAQRRSILEAVKAGTLSLEEAEQQLNNLD